MLNPYQKNNLVSALKEALEEAQKMPCETPCSACVHFDVGRCKKWKEAIPATELETGCPEWRFDEFSPPF